MSVVPHIQLYKLQACIVFTRGLVRLLQFLKQIRQQLLCFRRIDTDESLSQCRRNVSSSLADFSWANHTDVTLFDTACDVMQVSIFMHALIIPQLYYRQARYKRYFLNSSHQMRIVSLYSSGPPRLRAVVGLHDKVSNSLEAGAGHLRPPGARMPTTIRRSAAGTKQVPVDR